MRVEHAVGLTRVIVVLAEAGLRIEAVPLVRLTLECAVTATSSNPGRGPEVQIAADRQFREVPPGRFELPPLPLEGDREVRQGWSGLQIPHIYGHVE